MISPTRIITLAVAALVVFDGRPIPARACAFDGVFDGSFGISHPRSIEVAVAVRRAVEDGMLPPSALEPIVAGPAGLWRAAGRLRALERRRSAAADDATFPIAAMAVLFIDSGLWTRFTRSAGGYRGHIHAPPPAPGEIVIVSDEAVVAELLGGRLSVRAAVDRGLMIVDAPLAWQERVHALLAAAFDALPGAPQDWQSRASQGI